MNLWPYFPGGNGPITSPAQLVFCYYHGSRVKHRRWEHPSLAMPKIAMDSTATFIIIYIIYIYYTIPVYECLAYLLDRATTVTVNFLVLFLSLCFATIKKDCTIFSSKLRFFKEWRKAITMPLFLKSCFFFTYLLMHGGLIRVPAFTLCDLFYAGFS